MLVGGEGEEGGGRRGGGEGRLVLNSGYRQAMYAPQVTYVMVEMGNRSRDRRKQGVGVGGDGAAIISTLVHGGDTTCVFSSILLITWEASVHCTPYALLCL